MLLPSAASPRAFRMSRHKPASTWYPFAMSLCFLRVSPAAHSVAVSRRCRAEGIQKGPERCPGPFYVALEAPLRIVRYPFARTSVRRYCRNAMV